MGFIVVPVVVFCFILTAVTLIDIYHAENDLVFGPRGNLTDGRGVVLSQLSRWISVQEIEQTSDGCSINQSIYLQIASVKTS